MFKRLLTAFTLFTLFSSAGATFGAAPAEAASAKYEVYFVNLQKVINESDKGQQAKRLIKAKIAKAKAKIQALEKEIEKLQKELQSPVLSKEAKSKKEIELQKKFRELRQTQQDAQLEIAQLEQKYTSQIIKEVVELIRKYRKEKGIPVILETRESGVIAMDPKLDLTDTILKLYNQQAGK
jgi:outer membrane protein